MMQASRRTQYRECEYCHASLDPGERCDCAGARVADGRASREAPGRAIARCPLYLDRYRRGADVGITCRNPAGHDKASRMQRHPMATEISRDNFYRVVCRGDYTHCPVYMRSGHTTQKRGNRRACERTGADDRN